MEYKAEADDRSPQGGPGLNFTISTPVVTTNGGFTMCQISELVFVNPTHN